MPTRTRSKRSKQAQVAAAGESGSFVVSNDPVVVLHLDASAGSVQARRVFEAAREPFREVHDDGPDVPWAEFGGMAFVGLEDMRKLAAGLVRFDEVLIAGVRKHFWYLFDKPGYSVG